PVRAVLNCFDRLDHADTGKDRSVDAPGPLAGRVFLPELEGIAREVLTDFVNHRFEGECRVRRARSAVGGSLGLVDDDVVAVNSAIRDIVTREDAHRTGADRRAGVGPGFVRHIRFTGGNLSFTVDAQLHLDVRGGRRAGPFENV